MIILYGLYVIRNLLKYKIHCVKKIFIFLKKKNLYIKYITKFLNIKFIKIDFVSRKFLTNLVKNNNHQGICAVCDNLPLLKKKDFLLDLICRKKYPILLLLDRITDPYNLGACIRTTVAVDIIDAILITKYSTVDLKSSVIHKVSGGAIYKIDIVEIINVVNILIFLRKKNFFIIGTCISAQKSLFSFDFTQVKHPIVLILGCEQNGIKENIKKYCDILLKIPLKNVNSLNLSVSNGIFLFEIFRQLKCF